MNVDPHLVDDARSRLPAMIEEIEALVCCESPTGDRTACRASADLVETLGTQHLGVPPQRLDVDGVPHLLWTLGDPAAERRGLLLGHHDTVWPIGTLDRLPWRADTSANGPILRGPGCFDMKAGLVLMFHAVALLLRAGERPVTVLVTGDEEVGSPTSRELIEREARRSTATLVFEASGDGGALKHSRKGVSLYEVEVFGRAAHAGLEPERGINAGLELATQALQVARLGDEGAGTTVTPTVMRAGSTTNTVPAEGRFSVDVRAWTRAEQDRVHQQISALSPSPGGARVTVTGGPNRPPMEEAASRALVETAGRLQRSLGLPELRTMAVGGASDGNFSAGVGCPTLDGLGAVGGGAHADDEHVVARHLPDRAALVVGLLEELTR